MKIYSVRFRERKQSDPEFNFKEIYFVPTVAIGRCDEIDDTYITYDGYRKKATIYYIGIVWLTRSYAIEFWCDRKGVKQ